MHRSSRRLVRPDLFSMNRAKSHMPVASEAHKDTCPRQIEAEEPYFFLQVTPPQSPKPKNPNLRKTEGPCFFEMRDQPSNVSRTVVTAWCE